MEPRDTASQPAIFDDVPRHGRILTFSRLIGEDARPALRRLARNGWQEDFVVGFGAGLVSALEHTIAGLRPSPALVANGVAMPSTPADLWIWLRDDDPGDLVHIARAMEADLEDAFALDGVVDGFRHDGGRDLSGYELGPGNPLGDEAIEIATVADAGPGLDGAAFLAFQQWAHDLDALEMYEDDARDALIGRQFEDGERMVDAPASAHVRRVATGSSEASMLRRSMAWADGEGEGLLFLGFAASLDPFERALDRMLGVDDGVVDATFRWSRPTSAAHFWCPPVRAGMLDLRAVGL